MGMGQRVEADKTKLTDAEWSLHFVKLKAIPGIYIGGEFRCRRFVEAVLWVLRVGGQWRSLPAERGNWNSVFKRFARWSDLNIWNQLPRPGISTPPDQGLQGCLCSGLSIISGYAQSAKADLGIHIPNGLLQDRNQPV